MWTSDYSLICPDTPYNAVATWWQSQRHWGTIKSSTNGNTRQRFPLSTLGHHYSIHIRRGACCPVEMEYTPWSNHPPFTPCRAAYYTKLMVNCNPQALFKEEHRWKLIAMTCKHNTISGEKLLYWTLFNTPTPSVAVTSALGSVFSFRSIYYDTCVDFSFFFSVVLLFIVYLEIHSSVRSNLNLSTDMEDPHLLFSRSMAAATYQIRGHSEYPHHNALPNILRSLQWWSNACRLTPVI